MLLDVTGNSTYINVTFHNFIVVGFGDCATSNDSFGVRHVDIETWVLDAVLCC